MLQINNLGWFGGSAVDLSMQQRNAFEDLAWGSRHLPLQRALAPVYEVNNRHSAAISGEEEVAQQSRTTDVSWGGNCRSVAESTARMKFLPADLMRQVPPGSALLLHGTLPAAHLVGRRPWEDRRLRNLAAGKLPEPEKVTRSEQFLEALSVKSEVSEFVLAHMNQTLAGPDASSRADDKSDSNEVSDSDLTQAPDSNEPNGGRDTLDAPSLMAEQASAVERLNLLKAERDERPPMSIER